MKNCPTIHKFVGNREYMTAFVKTLPKKIRDPQKKGVFSGGAINDVSELERIDRTLLLIQSWAKAFSKSQSYPIFRELYEELLDKGVKFPEPEKDELAPVFTPAAKAPTPKESTKKSSEGSRVADGFKDPDCRAAAESALVLEQMVTASDAGNDSLRGDLVQTLVANARALQARIMTRLNSPVSESVLADILAANDVVNNALNYFQGVASGTMARKQPESVKSDKSEEKKKHKESKNREHKPPAISGPPASNTLEFDFSGKSSESDSSKKDSKPSDSESPKAKKDHKEHKEKHRHKHDHGKDKGAIPKISPPDSPFSLAPPEEGQHGHRVKSPDKARPTSPPASVRSNAGSSVNLFDFDPLSIPSPSPAAAAAKPAPAGGDFDEFMMLALRGKEEPKKKPADSLDEFEKLAFR